MGAYLKNGVISPDTTAPGLQEAREKLKFYSMSNAERHAYDEHVNAIMIQNDVLGNAKLEGLAEGRAEGLKEGHAKGKAEGLVFARAPAYVGRDDICTRSGSKLANKSAGKVSARFSRVLDVQRTTCCITDAYTLPYTECAI